MLRWNRDTSNTKPSETGWNFYQKRLKASIFIVISRYIVHDNICHMERKINYFLFFIFYYNSPPPPRIGLVYDSLLVRQDIDDISLWPLDFYWTGMPRGEQGELLVPSTRLQHDAKASFFQQHKLPNWLIQPELKDRDDIPLLLKGKK
jgi:hypothetical protein